MTSTSTSSGIDVHVKDQEVTNLGSCQENRVGIARCRHSLTWPRVIICTQALSPWASRSFALCGAGWSNGSPHWRSTCPNSPLDNDTHSGQSATVNLLPPGHPG